MLLGTVVRMQAKWPILLKPSQRLRTFSLSTFDHSNKDGLFQERFICRMYPTYHPLGIDEVMVGTYQCLRYS